MKIQDLNTPDNHTLIHNFINEDEKIFFARSKVTDYSWDTLMKIRRQIISMYETENTMPTFPISSHYVELHLSVGYKTVYQSVVGCFLTTPEKINAKSEKEALLYTIIEFIKWYNVKVKES